MTSSTKNVKLGACWAYFDGSDLGLTQGGVEVTVTTETHKVNVDQFGKTTINELIMGRNVTVKIPLAETTLRNLLATMPGATMITDGVQASAAVTYTATPTAASTLTIGGQVFTYHATAYGLYQAKLGATQAQSLANMVDVINRSMIQPIAGGVLASVNAAGTVITLKAGDPGVLGNAITVAATVGATAGAATFAGGVAETKARIEVSTGVGTDLLTMARLLRLHPKGKANSDFSEDFVVYQAATPGALTFAYKVDSERVYSIEFSGYPDASDRLFSIGDLLA